MYSIGIDIKQPRIRSANSNNPESKFIPKL